MGVREKLRVLVVDDMSTSRGILLQMLDKLGIAQVEYAENGVRAVERTKRSPPHLILSDLYMPEMNGLQLLQRLRADPATQRTGFILVTGRADPAVIDAGRKLGMNNFLTKPFDATDLKTCIEAVAGRL
ncbi:MAG: response regulator [Pseudomonadota bacterium]